MAKLPTINEMAQEVACRAVDECEYEGKTLREWIEIIKAQHGADLISRQALLDKFEQWQKTEDYSNDEWNLLVDVLSVIKSMPPAPQLGTNLAEVGMDCISRKAAIDAMAELQGRASTKAELKGISKAWKKIKKLPPAQPVIVPCNYVKACNEATMDDLTSAVLYLDVLEKLKKHGYVLVDMRGES